MHSSHDICRVGIILVPGFSMMAFASIVEPLRSANLVSGTLLYRWSYISPETGKVAASAGVEVISSGLASNDQDFDILVVCGGLGCETYKDERLFSFLRQSARRGALVGAISTASFLLARAGLLEERRCTVHWDFLDAFREVYPHIDVQDELFVFDRSVFTCAGGIAAMDVMLHLIQQRQGEALANLVADQFIHGQVRQGRDNQRMAVRNRISVTQPMTIKAIELMEAATDGYCRSKEVAKALRISTRQLERLFKKYLNTTPSRYHLKLRLERARRLLQTTTLSVVQVAVACGFASASHFTKCYREQFGQIPRADRQFPSLFANE